MSTEVVKDIVCPKCGHQQKYRLLTSISAMENPELKEKILTEELFDWQCEECNYFAAMSYPLIYTDTENRYVICFTPVGSTSTVEPTEAVQGFIKRRVKNLTELKEKILILDSGFDDVAIELVKNALCDIIRSSYKVKNVHAYFSRENNGELEFAIFLPGKPEPVYHATKTDVYGQSQEVLNTLKFEDPEGFVKVGKTLARQLLEEYENLE